MVAPTTKKPLFEGNYPSNESPLFFEFAFEPTAVSFKPQSTLLISSTKTKRKKVLYTAARLVFGVLVTGLVLTSGMLNNELLMGKSGRQAAMSWIPAWMESALSLPEAAATSTVIMPEKIDITTNAPASTTVLVGSKTNMAITPLASTKPMVDLKTPATALATNSAVTVLKEPTTPEEIEKTKEPIEPNVTTVFKPLIKRPVIQNRAKISEPVISRPAKRRITSDAFHAINAKSAIDGKRVFIKFGARWCLPCKMMEANVFPDLEISKLLRENYHTLTVDVDNIDGLNLRQFYQIEALPSFIILDNQQNIVGRHEGAQRIEALRSILGNNNP